MVEKFIEKWPQILPTLVGLVALLVYYLQEGQKRKEAASLIVLQINELTERLTIKSQEVGKKKFPYR